MSTNLSLSIRLDADWRALQRRPATASLLKGLAARCPGLPTGPDALVAALSNGRNEQLVRTLVSAAQRPGEGGQIAARIVLQALRPLAVRLARSSPAPFAEAYAEAVAALYEAVRTVPLARPGRVLANVRMDAVKRLFGARCQDVPAARRAIAEAAPVAQLADLAADVLTRAVESAEDEVLAAERAAGTVRRAAAAGLRTGELHAERIELLELLAWAMDERVITRGQAALLAEHGQGAESENAARTRRRAIARLREAAARYLAVSGS